MKNPEKQTKSLILAVETSGRKGSVGMAQGAEFLAEKSFSAPMKHSSELFPTSCELLKRYNRRASEVEQIFISAGPGSFTGLRIAVTMAKAMHFAVGTKIVAVSTLDVIAANASEYSRQEEDIKRIATILDAKRGEFFTAVYEKNNGRWTKILRDCLMGPDRFKEQFGSNTGKVYLLGEGLVYYSDRFKTDTIRILPEKYWYPRASTVYSLGYEKSLRGEFADPTALGPTYLRRAELEEKQLRAKK